MKIGKKRNKYCKVCKAQTEHGISIAKKRDRGALKQFSIQRARKRGRGQGFGNKGKYGSKPPISKFKRTGAKTSKKHDLRYKCSQCNKTQTIKKSFRAKKLEFKTT